MQTQESKSKTSSQFPDINDHLQHQKGVQAKKTRHQNWTTPEDIIGELVAQAQRKYRKGRRDVEAKVGFPMRQIDGLVLESDGLAQDPVRQRTLQHQQLEEIFQPLVEQAFDLNQLIGEMKIEIRPNNGCTITVRYQIRTPKQFRQ